MSVLAAWGTALVEALVQGGVRDIVISPGRRAWPVVRAAARHPEVRCHDIVDERAAAFFALGQSKITERPSVVLCTSGTAGAHFYPAVIEASQSRTPLLVLTGDGTAEERHRGARQVIDQSGLFGKHVRHAVDLGAPTWAPRALCTLGHALAQALLATRWPTPGPVHVNVPIPSPEMPSPEVPALEMPGADPASARPASPASSCRPPAAPRALADADAIAHLLRVAAPGRRGVIVGGVCPPSIEGVRELVDTLAARLHYPLLAEATSQLRFVGHRRGEAVRCDAFPFLLRSKEWRKRHAPEVVLQLGDPPTTSAVAAYAAEAEGCHRFVLRAHGMSDPGDGALATFVLGDLRDTLARIVEKLEPAQDERTPWESAFEQGSSGAWAALERELTRDAPLDEGTAIHTIVSALPKKSLLVLGNSLVTREIDLFTRGEQADVRVWSQCGVRGIDGLVSGAAGAASAFAGPVTALVGDITFLHDIGGLAAAPAGGAPFVVIVLNNGGGRIFDLYTSLGSEPDLAPLLAPHFVMPHERNFAHAAAFFGCAFARAASRAELARALAEAHARNGTTIIDVLVDASSAARAAARVAAGLAARH